MANNWETNTTIIMLTAASGFSTISTLHTSETDNNVKSIWMNFLSQCIKYGHE